MEQEFRNSNQDHPIPTFPIHGRSSQVCKSNVLPRPTGEPTPQMAGIGGEGAAQVAIIGAGAAGCICTYHLLKKGVEVTLFDKGSPLRTLLPTGGGRCNLAHAEYDFKELAKNYPRGEKFLISAFSRFSTWDTLAMFEEMGIKTYTQENGRIFPESNSAKEVRERVLKAISKAKFIKEEVVGIEKVGNRFVVLTNPHPNPLPRRGSKQIHKSDVLPHPTGEPAPQMAGIGGEGATFTHVIIATGGHSGYKLLKGFGIKIIEPKPALVGLNTQENFKDLSGTVCHGVNADGIQDDLLFTHFGVSGPLVYKISSLRAFAKFPYELELDLAPNLNDLQSLLNSYPHKDIKNILKEFLPLKVVEWILKDIFMRPSSAHSGSFSHQGRSVNMQEFKAHQINGKTRDLILNRIHNFKLTVTSTNRGEETVTAGGVDLDEINPKTMQIKKVPNLYCIGEVLNIDGFCGGFNLQNAWTTAFIASENIEQ